MNKPRLIFSAPIFTRSGYGDHARDILYSIWKMDKYDVSIVSMAWGGTPLTELQDESEFATWVREHLLQEKNVAKPDVFIQVSVANEFTPLGKFSLGITAGVETTVAPKSFVDGCNRMDRVLVPSKFTKRVLEQTTYTEQNKHTGQIIREHKIDTPIDVLFEGVDLDIFGKSHGHSILDGVEEDFNYLFVGHWLKGDHKQDRKDISGLIETFCSVFKNLPKDKRPGLILKTSHAGFSVIDRENIWTRIEGITQQFGDDCPSIYFLHGDLTPEELSSLYYDDKVKGMVSFTKGEGYGRPLCEFSITGKPVIASNWSGHTDFLTPDGAVLIDGGVHKVHPSVVDDFIMEESGWYTVDYKKAAGKLFDVYNRYDSYLEKSQKLGERNRKEFSLDKMVKDFQRYMERYVKTPEFREFKMPNLKLHKD